MGAEMPRVLTREVTAEDAVLVARLMREVQATLSDRSLYVISDEARVRHKLTEGCFGWVVELDGTPMGFYLFQVPCADDRDENIGYDAGLTGSDLEHVLVLDSVAVLPGARRMGLASRMLAVGEREGLRRGCMWGCTTVDPRNQANLRCLKRAGYQVVATIEGYSSADEGYVLHDGRMPAAPHPVTRRVLRKRLAG